MYEKISYENAITTITTLENKVSELEFKLKLLENITNAMNDYISDNNLNNYRFATNVSINSYEDYKRIKCIEIPATSYLVIEDK